MDDVTRARLERLGRAVARTSDRAASSDAMAGARARLFASGAERGRSRRLGVFALVSAALTLALAVVVFLVVRRPRGDEVRLTAGDPPVAVAIGQWVAASAEGSLDVRSSDGSAIALSPGGRARVTETTARGATVLLENGALDASIHHARPDTRWSFRAGPFDVAVVGTRFHVAWSASTEVFEIAMIEGSVTVSGPLLAEGRTIYAGERLRVGVREAAFEIVRGETRAPPSAQASVEPAPERAVEEPASSSSSSARPSPSASSSAAYRELLAAGKYADAMTAIEQVGFASTIERASTPELYAIADAARFSGRADRAREALLLARKRGARGKSAFLLGKLAADQRSGDAASWFDTYLREEPNGALAEQALGRLLELTQRDPARARPLAERYLASYPSGAFAALARSIAGP